MTKIYGREPSGGLNANAEPVPSDGTPAEPASELLPLHPIYTFKPEDETPRESKRPRREDSTVDNVWW
jgi:hypothetical protein